MEGQCVQKVTEMTKRTQCRVADTDECVARESCITKRQQETGQGPKQFSAITLFVQGRLIQSTRNRQLVSYTWTQY